MISLPRPFTSFAETLFGSFSPQSKPYLHSTQGRTRLRVSAAWPRSRPQTATMYELLAVSETAGPAEIKAAYWRQARRWHPDTCRSASEKPFFTQQFMLAREAYEILSDPALRRDYDLSLRVAGAAVPEGPMVWAQEREGFRDWEAQLERLWRRSAWTREETWGSRMRSGAAHRSD